MAKPIIYIQQSFKNEQIEQIKELTSDYQIVCLKEELAQLDKDAIEIMIGWDKDLGKQLLDSPISRLKWVQAVSAGLDHFDLSQFQKKEILLSNGGGVHSISIAEHVLGVLLAETRGIRQSIQQQSLRNWQNGNIAYQQLSGQKMLVVGTGKIGQQIAQYAGGLGIQTYGINTSGHSTNGFIECYSLEKINRIIKEMTIIVNILPLTKETYHLYNRSLFNVMKPNTFFVNVGRGLSVNTEDLEEALLNGQIKFAALDVFEEEPLATDSPLWDMDNVLITSHISGLTPHFKAKILAIVLANLKSFLTDKTLVKNEVSLTRGY